MWNDYDDEGDPFPPSNGDFANGFTMEFNYAFDTSRGDGICLECRVPVPR